MTTPFAPAVTRARSWFRPVTPDSAARQVTLWPTSSGPSQVVVSAGPPSGEKSQLRPLVVPGPETCSVVTRTSRSAVFPLLRTVITFSVDPPASGTASACVSAVLPAASSLRISIDAVVACPRAQLDWTSTAYCCGVPFSSMVASLGKLTPPAGEACFADATRYASKLSRSPSCDVSTSRWTRSGLHWKL